jgi:hypothetical protein
VRRAANIDSNHVEIVNAFRGLGCSVETLHRVGDSVPDLLVGVAGLNLLVEVKRGDGGPAKAALTADQERWHAAWRGQVCIVRSLEEVGRLVTAARMLREIEEEKAEA